MRLKKRNRNPPRKYNLQRQLARNMNIFDLPNSVTTNINIPVTIYTNATSGGYSFSSAADTRFLAFNTIASIGATADFGKYASVLQEYRIKAASVILCRVQALTTAVVATLPALYLTVDPEVNVASNPNNTNLLESDNAKFVPATILEPKSITFTFPGVGEQTNIWANVNQTTAGSFYIGANTTSAIVPAIAAIVYDCIFSLVCEFRGSLSH